MITNQSIIDSIWGSSDTEIIELDEEVPNIIRSLESSLTELEVAKVVEENLASIKRELQVKIAQETSTHGIAKFNFSESSDNRLIGSGNIGKPLLFSNLVDSAAQLTSECNRIKRAKQEQEIFRFTDFTLPNHIRIKRPVKTEVDFKLFVDGLYQNFYEASGSCNRIPDHFKNDEQFILFGIKYLRSLFDHDPELDRDPINKDRLIADACIKYTNRRTIIGFNPNDFLGFQEKLLRELILFLEELRRELLT